jgi:starch synthase
VALKILAVTSEAFPLAKTGGLGDAVSGLAHSLGQSGIDVTLMLPAYPQAMEHVHHVRQVATLRDLPGGEAVLLAADCHELQLPVLLLKNDALYDRDGLYVSEDGVEFPDNALRFAALSQAAASVAQGLDGVPRPHVVHVHDWHTALTPLFMHQLHIEDVKTVITLHNVAFQGVFPLSLAPSLGIEAQYCTDEGLEFWGQLNFLKAGIRYADVITVVSRNYAKEILTPKFGCGLEGVLKSRAADIVAIPNGIDMSLWNPQNDPYLRGRAFSAEHLANKAVCKAELQRTFGLAQDPAACLMAMGSRLTTQKMADVAAAALPIVLDKHPTLQVCVIGHGDKALERELLKVAARYPGRCGVHIGFDEGHAHLLHAGSDVLLHGSRFEPFGLTPLYSMLYGTIPIGSRVGGMADTILDPGADQGVAAMRSATGILFEGERADDMVMAIDRALALHEMPTIWRAMQLNGMRADFSWTNTAPAYARTYQSLRPDVALDRIPERRRSVPPLRVLQPSKAAAALAAAKQQGRGAGKPGDVRTLRKGVQIGTLTSHEAAA